MSSTTSFAPPRQTDTDKDDGAPTLGDHATKDDSAPSPTSRISAEEAKLYYYGLPSRPVLVARTTTTPWEMPTGPEVYLKPKELRVVGRHKIVDVWNDNMAGKVFAILDENKVQVTSIDLVRFGYYPGEPSGGVIVWIGVQPGSLSQEGGHDVAHQCKRVLSDNGLTDVDVEIRESIVYRG